MEQPAQAAALDGASPAEGDGGDQGHQHPVGSLQGFALVRCSFLTPA